MKDSVYNDEQISDENLSKLLVEVEDINAGGILLLILKY